ncbi:MAG: hypothetical protein SF051_13870 [Elusimicrobiota bacterium]|nr:hypothetical protein [Elusimicrobiota bacterium]
MIRTRIAAAALAALVLAGRAEAQSEAAAAGARAAFDLSIISPQPEFRRSMRNSWQVIAQANPGAGFFTVNAALIATADLGAAAAPTVEVDLASLLNKQLKTSLKYTVGGKDVWVGGAFDRAQNAFVSILVDGEPAKFYNVRSLLDREQALQLGTASYKMYLAPNVINQMKSEIILENAADEDDKIRITLKKMMDAAGAAGHAVTLGTQAYRVFYTDDVRNGQADPSSKVLTFLLVDARGEIHVFLIPAELVPGDKIAVFKMFEDKRVGLTQTGGRLKIYENP